MEWLQSNSRRNIGNKSTISESKMRSIFSCRKLLATIGMPLQLKNANFWGKVLPRNYPVHIKAKNTWFFNTLKGLCHQFKIILVKSFKSPWYGHMPPDINFLTVSLICNGPLSFKIIILILNMLRAALSVSLSGQCAFKIWQDRAAPTRFWKCIEQLPLHFECA